jgi:hypothetical protein
MSKLQDRDAIVLPLRAEKTVVNTTQKLSVTIVGMVGDDPQTDTVQAFRAITEAFMPGVEWSYSGLQMQQHESGLEQVSVVATTRVDESKLGRLEQRAQQVSASTKIAGITLAIKDPTIDLTFPLSLIDRVESELRVEIAKKALVECAVLSKAMDVKYAVARIEFDRHTEAGLRGSRMASDGFHGSAASSSAASYGKGFTGESDEIGNAKKFALSAIVTLTDNRKTSQ